jgi:hypothetical protein
MERTCCENADADTFGRPPVDRAAVVRPNVTDEGPDEIPIEDGLNGRTSTTREGA